MRSTLASQPNIYQRADEIIRQMILGLVAKGFTEAGYSSEIQSRVFIRYRETEEEERFYISAGRQRGMYESAEYVQKEFFSKNFIDGVDFINSLPDAKRGEVCQAARAGDNQ